MTLTDRLILITEHASLFTEFTGAFSDKELRDWIRQDLGNADALFDSANSAQARSTSLATPLSPSLVVLSGNTPHAAAQSLLRTLILGSHTHFKLPSSGLPEFQALLKKLPAQLQKLVTTSSELPTNWQEHYQALVVYGSDETITWFSQCAPPHMRFLKHGQRLAIALVSSDAKEAAKLAAKDICLYDQQGCQSLHNIYLSPKLDCSPHEFCELLSAEIKAFLKEHPRSPLNLSEAGAISDLRETTRYLSANDPTKHRLYESKDNTEWTIIYQDAPEIELSPLNRVAFVKPWPKNIKDLGPETRHLSALAIHPWPETISPDLLTVAPPRICPLGSCQFPPLTWHHDGLPSLGSLVKWTDLA